MVWTLRIAIGFEFIRLIGWITLFLNLGKIDPTGNASGESGMMVVQWVFALGMPYSWVGAFITGSWAIIPSFASSTKAMVAAQFLLWIMCTSALLVLLIRVTKRGARDRGTQDLKN